MKKLLIASLLAAFTLSAQAETDNKVRIDKVIAELASGKTIEQIIKDANTEPVAIVNDLAAAQPESIIEIVIAAIKANPEKAAEIVQAAVEANPELASDIVNAAVAAGADQDEMIVAALLGGANEEDIALKTAAGGFATAPALGAAPSQPGLGGGTGGGGATASPN